MPITGKLRILVTNDSDITNIYFQLEVYLSTLSAINL